MFCPFSIIFRKIFSKKKKTKKISHKKGQKKLLGVVCLSRYGRCIVNKYSGFFSCFQFFSFLLLLLLSFIFYFLMLFFFCCFKDTFCFCHYLPLFFMFVFKKYLLLLLLILKLLLNFCVFQCPKKFFFFPFLYEKTALYSDFLFLCQLFAGLFAHFG